MTFDEYVEKAMRTRGLKDFNEKLVQGVLGLAGEAGEVVDLYKKYRCQGHRLDGNALVDELGDVLWYVAAIASTLGVSLDLIAERNIVKLQERYPEGFSVERSVNRG